MKKEGTIIQVRNIHKNNESHRKKFFAVLNTSYEAALNLLTSYSYRLWDKELIVTQAIKEEDALIGNVRELWRTPSGNNFFQNTKNILQNQFRNTFPNMTESMV
jgi:hypothetical protein